MIGELINHLWQSTLFALLAALLTMAFRNNRAEVRYWLWFSASLKFLIPFSLLLSVGSHLQWPATAKRIAPATVSLAAQKLAQPFPDAMAFETSSPGGVDWPRIAILGVWTCGFLGVAFTRLRGWQRIRAAVRSSTSVEIPTFKTPASVEIRISPGLLEPGVVGLCRHVLLLPAGIIDRLTPPQLEAVLAHEVCHVRRRDNLSSSIHMATEAIWWFHPLVWWIGTRVIEERERACDEEVLRSGSDPRVYAEAILNVCKLYVESPLACVSGVTGTNLKRRVEAIMRNHMGQGLGRAKKVLLASAAVAVVAFPLVIGVGNPLPIRAQLPAGTQRRYETVIIRSNHSGANNSTFRLTPGGWIATNISLRLLITHVYPVMPFSVSSGPEWLDSARYDIEARSSGSQTNDQNVQMFRALLADRFQFRFHWETRELPVYALLIAENGPKLEPSRDGCTPVGGPPGLPPCGFFSQSVGRMDSLNVTTKRFAAALSRLLNQMVLDRTGLDGTYAISLRFAVPDPTQAPVEPIVTAVRDQLGLKLESQKGSVEVLVVDHAERPSGN